MCAKPPLQITTLLHCWIYLITPQTPIDKQEVPGVTYTLVRRWGIRLWNMTVRRVGLYQAHKKTNDVDSRAVMNIQGKGNCLGRL